MNAHSALMLLVLIMLPSVSFAGDPQLSAPGVTVQSYCQSGTHDIHSKYFEIETFDYGVSAPTPMPWETCKIVCEHPARTDSESVAGVTRLSGDMEVITKVTFDSGETEQYWYLVREFEGDWKIISYYAIGTPEPLEQ